MGKFQCGASLLAAVWRWAGFVKFGLPVNGPQTSIVNHNPEVRRRARHRLEGLDDLCEVDLAKLLHPNYQKV